MRRSTHSTLRRLVGTSVVVIAIVAPAGVAAAAGDYPGTSPAAVSANSPAVAHSGPRWGSRRGAMATPFGCPAGCPARNVGALSFPGRAKEQCLRTYNAQS